MPELEFWHVAVWTKKSAIRVSHRFLQCFPSKKQKPEVFAHSHVFSIGIYGVPCLLRFFRFGPVSSFAFVCLLVSLSLLEGGWGGDVDIHGDAACDIRLCFSSYVLFLSWGWEGGMGGMLTSMAMRLVQLCYSLMCFLFSFAFVGGGGGGGGGAMAIICARSFRILLCGGRVCFVTVC